MALRAPEFAESVEWVGTDHPIRLTDLRGRLVLLDFWTYCCINCMHILPKLRRLEERFEGAGLTVLGVHSPKFLAERETSNLATAMARLGVRHPTANDREFSIWKAYGARSWPTTVLVGPDGTVLGRHEGEFSYDAMARTIGDQLQRLAGQGKLTPGLESPRARPGQLPKGLAFPGKVALGPDGLWLIADTAHGRVWAVDADGEAVRCWTGMTGPQGMLAHGDDLLVADPEGGTVWRAPLAGGEVHPVAAGLRSPWDLTAVGDTVYVAMAGTHQIAVLEDGEARVFCGSGQEGLRDGPARSAQMAQPSGITAAERVLYVTDSEASAIREVRLQDGAVSTLIGEGLFTFGDQTGPTALALLQHPLGVAHDAAADALYIADSYNGKVKRMDPGRTAVTTVARGLSEPGGIAWDPRARRLLVADTNHHRVVWVDPGTGSVTPFDLHLG